MVLQHQSPRMCLRISILKGRETSRSLRDSLLYVLMRLTTESAGDVGYSGRESFPELLHAAVALLTAVAMDDGPAPFSYNEGLQYLRQPACLQLDTELPPFCWGVGSRSSRLTFSDDTAHDGAEAESVCVIFGEAALQVPLQNFHTPQ